MSHPPLPPPRDGAPRYRLCFVCTGNICRSPMAEAVLRHLSSEMPLGAGTLADRLALSSVGTGPWHEGEPMDDRAREALGRAGYPDHGHVARHLSLDDLEEVDLLVALDRRHMQTLRSMGGGRLASERIVLLRSFDPVGGGAPDVDDPYYGDADVFAQCLAAVESACRGLAGALVRYLGSGDD